VTAIPTVFGAGKWVASLPTGYLLGWLGRRPLMVSGLLVIALSDVASVMTSAYGVFLGFRAIAGVGWAMFGTVATATMVDLPAAQRRGRAVSLLMMSETSGLLLGTAAGGWLYQGLGVASPFLFEAACLLAAAIFVARWALPPASQEPAAGGWGDRHQLGAVLRAPGVLDASVTNAVLTVIQTGVLVFLFPLYLVNRGVLLHPDGSLTDRARTILARTPMGRFGDPTDLQGPVLWLCSDAAAFVTGAVIPVGG